MVDIFLIMLESIKSGNKGWLSQKTRKTSDGIKLEFVADIISTEPESDITSVVAYFTRGGAEVAKKLVMDEIELRYPGAVVNVDVVQREISIQESKLVSQNTWAYK